MSKHFLVIAWLAVLVFASLANAQEVRRREQARSRDVVDGAFVASNDLLSIRVRPKGTDFRAAFDPDPWVFRYSGTQSADANPMEHFVIWTPSAGGTSSYDMQVLQNFVELQPNRVAEARLRYTDGNGRQIDITRRVELPEGATRWFHIHYFLTNTGTVVVPQVRFFQIVEWSIVDFDNDYAWYNPATDTVFMNDDRYFRAGFFGSKPSDAHGLGAWDDVLRNDWTDGQLNNLSRWPDQGTGDAGTALQWNVGDLPPGQTWEIRITFVFGGSAGIQALLPSITVRRGRDVVLDGSASNSVDTIVAYEWDLDNDGEYDDATGAQVVYRWDTLGQYPIRLRVRDNRGRVDETTAMITVVPDRDLQVAQVSLNPSENLKDGQVVTANVRIRNDGIDAASQSFRVVLLASAGGANERWVGYQDVPSLGGGAVTEIALPVRLRGNDSRLRVVVDHDNWISEFNEANNSYLLEFAPVPAPDLVVSGIRIQPDSGLVDGQTAQAVVTVTNNGADTLSNFRVLLQQGVTGNPMPVNASARVNGGLSAGASVEVAIPFEVRGGTGQTIGAQVDDLDEVGESDEGNNGIRSSDATVRERAEARLPDVALPDLVVESLSTLPASDIAYGQDVTLRAVVRNAGGTTLRPIAVQFLIDSDSMGVLTLNGLAEGASQPLSATWRAVSGTHTMRVIADPYFRVPDASFDNNRVSVT